MSEPSNQADDRAPLFQSTSAIAGQQAALKNGSMRRRILERLRKSPATLWEIAAEFKIPDHVISGRFTELSRDLYIERSGERRNHPVTGCPADVWRLRGVAASADPDVAELLGYPITLKIDGDLYDLQPLLPQESYPGMPYARRADTGGLRLAVRVEQLECPGCGKPLQFVMEDGKKKFRCGVSTCNRTWSLVIAERIGKSGVAALVMRTH